MSTSRTLPALVVALALMVACGDDNGSADSTSTTVAATTSAATTTSSMPPTTSTLPGPTTTSSVTTTMEAPTTTDKPAGLEQPAIWPAAGVVFDTPEEAAADFVNEVLGVEPVLGEFMPGDSRSGEIEVFSPGEGGVATRSLCGLLLVRQLGSEGGWFIIAAPNDYASITSPESAAVVAAGPIAVEGVARGFEGNVIVTASLAGDAEAMLDSQFTQAGARETAEPYSVTLDLSGAGPGDTVMLLVRGDVGLETDPGEFGAIPVVIAG